jgi:hypothetical protein
MTLNCSRIGRYILLGTTAALAGLSTSAARGQASVEILSPPDNAQLTVKMTDLMLVVYARINSVSSVFRLPRSAPRAWRPVG